MRARRNTEHPALAAADIRSASGLSQRTPSVRLVEGGRLAVAGLLRCLLPRLRCPCTSAHSGRSGSTATTICGSPLRDTLRASGCLRLRPVRSSGVNACIEFRAPDCSTTSRQLTGESSRQPLALRMLHPQFWRLLRSSPRHEHGIEPCNAGIARPPLLPFAFHGQPPELRMLRRRRGLGSRRQ